MRVLAARRRVVVVGVSQCDKGCSVAMDVDVDVFSNQGPVSASLLAS